MRRSRAALTFPAHTTILDFAVRGVELARRREIAPVVRNTRSFVRKVAVNTKDMQLSRGRMYKIESCTSSPSVCFRGRT